MSEQPGIMVTGPTWPDVMHMVAEGIDHDVKYWRERAEKAERQAESLDILVGQLDRVRQQLLDDLTGVKAVLASRDATDAAMRGADASTAWASEVHRLQAQRDDYSRKLAEVTAERDALIERIGTYGPVLNTLKAINGAGLTWNIQVDPKPDAE